MIDPTYVQTLAAYSKWQNDSLFAAAATLSDSQRREDRGAFFKSIHATLSHVLWGDAMWMSRFSDVPRPAAPFPGVDHASEWDWLARSRIEMDDKVIAWAAGLTSGDLDGDLVWRSGLMGGEVCKPRWLAITHMFNHQTHHRGQVHVLLTGFGVRPQVTDLILSPLA